MAVAGDTYTRLFGPQTPSIARQVIESVSKIGIQTGAGALAGYAFGMINPVGGAVFGLASTAGQIIADKINENFYGNRTNVKVANYILSIAIGAGAVALAGIPLSFGATVGLTAAMILTTIAINLAVGTAQFGADCVGGAALACRDRFC